MEIPYIAHESIVTRMERTNKRLFILCIILVICLVGSNAAWLCYESQFEDEVYTQEADVETSGNAIINNGGDLNYGTGQNTADN